MFALPVLRSGKALIQNDSRLIELSFWHRVGEARRAGEGGQDVRHLGEGAEVSIHGRSDCIPRGLI
jgi:hypothetical protein